ncbi:hypothetical protein MPTK1_4g13550 [Marchantia polymorpha subsp. ruderalis]|uniref:Uncharacterized protein n=2 Tax=Marchantia polymorpha TaxID=3197 RepID=A0AAF6B9J9_MARPO|nr:hypothetical protein MARPO_0070s0001 [Marchantia polymorpha]BBN08683.1 hypothetical protein Mp_4g13550 [Marchantia polymorpha subsp. ruderalis]|eukprot:PTQ35525.1 hypothetical protein MARPO_0070s0001 [Marchantia polymorpha]
MAKKYHGMMETMYNVQMRPVPLLFLRHAKPKNSTKLLSPKESPLSSEARRKTTPDPPARRLPILLRLKEPLQQLRHHPYHRQALNFDFRLQGHAYFTVHVLYCYTINT